MPSPEERTTPEPLTLAAVLPGLLLILLVDLATVLKLRHVFGPYFNAWNLLITILPWVTLILFRKSPAKYGYRRQRALAGFGWGMVAGGVWRGLSLGFNSLFQGGWSQIGGNVHAWFGAVIWIPFVEETFFRGYIGAPLVKQFGRWPGILVQALIFSLHPGHWSQGWPHLASIFAFGILAGWLFERYQSIWPSWGAHAFGNVLPYFLQTRIT